MAGKDSIKTVKTLVAVLVTVWIAVCPQAQTLSLSRVSRLIFDGEPNRIYEIQYSTDLNSPNWQTLGSVKGDDFGKTVVIDDSQGSRFYRTMLGNFLSVTLDASPANGVALAAGEGGEVAAYTLLAGASDMNVARVTLEFDSRLWLYADAVRLVDLESNTFLGSRENLNAADFAELTVGARYSLDFPLAYTVPGGTRQRVAVIPRMRAVSDRPLGIVGIIRAETRATDAVGVSHTDSTDKDRFFIYKGGEVNAIETRVNPSSPLTRLVEISRTAQTDNVLLGRFDVKSRNQGGTLSQIVFGLDVLEPKIVPITQLFGEVKISINGRTYSADTLALNDGADFSGYARFSNLNEVLPADQNVTISVYGKVNQDTEGGLSGATIGVRLTTSTSAVLLNNPEVVDRSNQPIDVVPAVQTANSVSFSSIPGVVSGLSASVGGAIIVNNETTAYPVSFTFTLTAGDSTLYMAAIPQFLMAVPVGAIFGPPIMEANPGSLPGDANGNYFVIPAGSSRTFMLSSVVSRGTASGVGLVDLFGIAFGTESSNLNRYYYSYRPLPIRLPLTF